MIQLTVACDFSCSSLIIRNSFQRGTWRSKCIFLFVLRRTKDVGKVSVLSYNHNSLDEPALNALNLYADLK
jgi:hypothetical protein